MRSMPATFLLVRLAMVFLAMVCLAMMAVLWPLPANAQEPIVPFIELDPSSGFDFTHQNGATGVLYFVEMMGPGGAFLDYDSDGDLDLYLVQGTRLEPAGDAGKAAAPMTARLYRNDLSTGADGQPRLRFTDVTATAGLPVDDYGVGVTSGDFDNDGAVDLYLTNFGSNRLLRNQGDGTFADVTARAGVGDRRWSAGAAFLDFDRDGWLDLYVLNYVDFSLANHRFCPSATGARDYCGPQAYKPLPDRLFRNRGDGTFEDVSGRAGIAKQPGSGLGVVAADYDGDGWLDLYVANDEMPNHLFLNRKDGTFRDEALLGGCAVSSEGVRQSSMGVAAGDLNNDGNEDLFMTHLNGQTNTVYLNDGEAIFQDASVATGLGAPSLGFTGFGTGLFDYDGDGVLDVLAVNGAVRLSDAPRNDTLAQRNQLFHGLGNGRFTEVTATAGAPFERQEVSRGAAFGDVDNDGDTDVLVINNNGPARLLRNQVGAKAGWLGLRLVGTPGNRDMLGARAALLRPDRPPLWRRVHTDGSYASANDPRLRFGLGNETPERLEVRVHWPSGKVERFKDLRPGRYTTLREGTGEGISVGLR